MSDTYDTNTAMNILTLDISIKYSTHRVLKFTFLTTNVTFSQRLSFNQKKTRTELYLQTL